MESRDTAPRISIDGVRVINLKDLSDQAPSCDLAPGLEIRVADVPLDLLQCGLSHYRLAPGHRLPFSFVHERQEQIYVLISGSASAKMGDETVQLEPWDAARVQKDILRSVEAGDDGVEFLSFGVPHSKWEHEINLEYGSAEEG